MDVILRVFYEEKLFPRKYDVNFAWYLRGNSLRVFSEEIFESTNFIGVTRFFTHLINFRRKFIAKLQLPDSNFPINMDV